METKNMLYLVSEYAPNGEIFGTFYSYDFLCFVVGDWVHYYKHVNIFRSTSWKLKFVVRCSKRNVDHVTEKMYENLYWCIVFVLNFCFHLECGLLHFSRLNNSKAPMGLFKNFTTLRPRDSPGGILWWDSTPKSWKKDPFCTLNEQPRHVGKTNIGF